MPWCEPCARYLAPSAMTAEGRCPRCGTIAELNSISGRPLSGSDLRDLAGQDKAPWHFKLLVFLLVVYLGWRVVDLFI